MVLENCLSDFEMRSTLLYVHWGRFCLVQPGHIPKVVGVGLLGPQTNFSQGPTPTVLTHILRIQAGVRHSCNPHVRRNYPNMHSNWLAAGALVVHGATVTRALLGLRDGCRCQHATCRKVRPIPCNGPRHVSCRGMTSASATGDGCLRPPFRLP